MIEWLSFSIFLKMMSWFVAASSTTSNHIIPDENEKPRKPKSPATLACDCDAVACEWVSVRLDREVSTRSVSLWRCVSRVDQSRITKNSGFYILCYTVQYSTVCTVLLRHSSMSYSRQKSRSPPSAFAAPNNLNLEISICQLWISQKPMKKV